MKFILDGDGYVPDKLALSLLTDIVRPYPDAVFIHPYLLKDTAVPSWYKVMNLFDDMRFREVQFTSDMKAELITPEEKMFIVAGADTRKELVSFCQENHIQVLDLTRALYPVMKEEDN